MNLVRLQPKGGGSDIKPYIVNFECDDGYIGQILAMEQEGQDKISGVVGNDGKLTLYPMYSGAWICKCYSEVAKTTKEKTIELTYWGVQPTIKFEDIPNGEIVTPINDVQTWLNCANIWDKSYTTVAEVIADTTLFTSVIDDENANAYLFRSTNFATDICSNSNAMTYVGNNDKCASVLLNDETWCNAICNSAYFEKVLNVKVPTMTGPSSPSGAASASGNYTTYYPYLAFNTNSNGWLPSSNGAYWIQYEFPMEVTVRKVRLKSLCHGGASTNLQVEIYDGTKFVPIKSIGTVAASGEVTVNIPNSAKSKYLRISGTWNYIGYGYKLWLYGRE